MVPQIALHGFDTLLGVGIGSGVSRAIHCHELSKANCPRRYVELWTTFRPVRNSLRERNRLGLLRMYLMFNILLVDD